MTHTKRKAKNTVITLSCQVEKILQEKGLSKIFNHSDFTYFKAQVKYAFNQAQAIADLFIQENRNTRTDYHDYIY